MSAPRTINLHDLPKLAGFGVGKAPQHAPKYKFDASLYPHVWAQVMNTLRWPEWNSAPSLLKLITNLGIAAAGPFINDFVKGDGGAPADQCGNIISHIPPEGIVIVKPGLYKFDSDVTWTPNAPNTAAITISCNSVTLDLQGHTLLCDSDEKDTVGVLIGSKTRLLHGVRMINGIIKSFAMHGVCALGVMSLSLLGVVVKNMQESAETNIIIVGCTYVFLRGCVAEATKVHSGTYSGVQVRFCAYVTLLELRAENLRNEGGGCSALTILACSDVSVQSCAIENIATGSEITEGSPGQTCLGIFGMLSAAVYISNATVKNIAGSIDDAHAIAMFFCVAEIFITDCIVDNITTGFHTSSGSGAKCTGVEIMFTNHVHVLRTHASNVRASNPQFLSAAGFSCSGTDDVVFESCSASEVSVIGSGTGAGFGWAADPRPLFVRVATHTRYIQCMAEKCKVGFDLFYQRHAVVQDCLVEKVPIPVLDDPEDVRVLTCNEATECHPPMSVRVKNEGYANVII